MNVLSLFDGMSCGRIALERLGIEVNNYYASEIDKYAIQIAQKNYPDTKQIGDVLNWRSWDIDWSSIDLVSGGFPCQSWSLAGKQLGDKDERGKMFWVMLDIMKKVIENNPNAYYLMENVRMKKEFEEYITYHTEQALPNVNKYLINSALVSAQNRVRYYWTNIPNVEQPKQRGIILRDILESSDFWSKKQPKYLKNHLDGKPRGDRVKSINEKASCLTATMYKGQIQSWVKKQNNYPDNVLDKMTTKDGKSYCLTARYQGAEPKNSIKKKQRTMIPVNKNKKLPENISLIYDNHGKSYKPIKVGMNVEQVKVRKHEVDIISLQYLLREMKKESGKTNKQIAEETNTPITKIEHWFRTDSSFAIPSDDIWFRLKEVLGIKTDVFDKQIMEFEYRDGVYESTQRVYSDKGKSPTLTASNKEQMIETQITANTPKQVGIAVDINGHDILKRVYSENGKSPTLNACTGGNREPKVMVDKRKPNQINPSKKANGVQPYMQDRVFHVDGKSHALTREFASRTNVGDEQEVYWRKLTPIECERLQTVPDNYTEGVSNTQRYKMLGNSFTVDVICHILKNMELKEGQTSK